MTVVEGKLVRRKLQQLSVGIVIGLALVGAARLLDDCLNPYDCHCHQATNTAPKPCCVNIGKTCADLSPCGPQVAEPVAGECVSPGLGDDSLCTYTGSFTGMKFTAETMVKIGLSGQMPMCDAGWTQAFTGTCDNGSGLVPWIGCCKITTTSKTVNNCAQQNTPP